VQPPQGLIFTEVTAPLILPNPALDISDPAEVEAYTQHFRIPVSFLALLDFGWGEAAVATALRESGMDEIQYADYTFFTILGIYSRHSVHVHGTRL
jgi:hypothetical protein